MGPVHNFAVDKDESYCVDGIVTHNCLCAQTAIVDSDHFRRRTAVARGEQEPPRKWESGTREPVGEWLRRKPEGFQRELLGPTRLRMSQRGVPVLDRNGKPLPVHQMLGRPPPTRDLGPAIRARGAIQRDREGQVLPFPRVAPSRR